MRRYTLTIDKSTIEKRFGAKFYIAQESYDYEATYNAAPSQMLPIVRTYHGDRIELARWGFWPEEWKRSTRARPMINARLETAAEKPMFASSFRTRHCLVLADGYYELRTVGKHKQPYRIILKTGEPFAMAGMSRLNSRRPKRTRSISRSSRGKRTRPSATSTTGCP